MSCENNKAIKCACTFSCPRHGKCCECVAYHAPRGDSPVCFAILAAGKSNGRDEK